MYDACTPFLTARTATSETTYMAMHAACESDVMYACMSTYIYHTNMFLNRYTHTNPYTGITTFVPMHTKLANMHISRPCMGASSLNLSCTALGSSTDLMMSCKACQRCVGLASHGMVANTQPDMFNVVCVPFSCSFVFVYCIQMRARAESNMYRARSV